MRPIQLSLLIHSATLRHPIALDAWQNVVYTDTELKHIRIEPCKKVSHKKDSTEVTLSSVLFFDCVNSRPRSVSFEVGDKLIFDGAEYTVLTAKALYDGCKLHHYEVVLV